MDNRAEEILRQEEFNTPKTRMSAGSIEDMRTERNDRPTFDLIIAKNAPGWLGTVVEKPSDCLVVDCEKVRQKGIDLYEIERLFDHVGGRIIYGEGDVFDHVCDRSDEQYIIFNLSRERRVRKDMEKASSRLEEYEPGFQNCRQEMVDYLRDEPHIMIYDYASAPNWPKAIPDHGGDEDNMMVINLAEMSVDALAPIQELINAFRDLGCCWGDVVVFFEDGKIYEYSDGRDIPRFGGKNNAKALCCVVTTGHA